MHSLKVLRHGPHSFTSKLHHTCLSFVNPDGAIPNRGCRHPIATYYSLSTPKGWKAELTWLVDLQRTVYPHKWSPVSYRSSAGPGKFGGQRLTFYRCATQQRSSYRKREVKRRSEICVLSEWMVPSTSSQLSSWFSASFILTKSCHQMCFLDLITHQICCWPGFLWPGNGKSLFLRQ